MTKIAMPSGEALSLKALSVAQGYADAHIQEQGGNNRGPEVQLFQKMGNVPPGSAWCACFVLTDFVKAYAQLCGLEVTQDLLLSYRQPVYSHYLTFNAYCPMLWNNAKAKGLTRDRTYLAQPGDIVMYDFAHKGEPHHTGIIKSASKFTIIAVEGNTPGVAAGNQADGDGVWQKVRPRDGRVFGYITLRGIA